MEKTGNWKTVDLLDLPTQHDFDHPRLEQFLQTLAQSRLLTQHELLPVLSDLPDLSNSDTLVLSQELVARGLINEYQAHRLLAGQTFGLMLGNYRVLDCIGSGGMGIVYKAEHVHMKRLVALKVLAIDEEEGQAVFIERFNSEMQALAVLRHPNIVLAFDAGEVEIPGGDAGKKLHYLVMEFVAGQDLEQYVIENPLLPIHVACDFIRQAANGLRHAHEHGLIHRDIKPSNLLITSKKASGSSLSTMPNGQVKILDFGLARLVRRRHTEAHSLLGTIDYMAPEQARDARAVDIRADIYGLGGTLYWLLTGKKPFPKDRPIVEELLARQYETPEPIRHLRPDVPAELEAVVCQMMARDADDRYPNTLAVIAALNDFAEPAAKNEPGCCVSPSHLLTQETTAPGSSATTWKEVLGSDTMPGARSRRVLIVGPEPADREAWRAVLEHDGVSCIEADRESTARGALAEFPADVMVVDARTGGGTGGDLCRHFRADGPLPHLKLVLVTADEDSPVGETEFAWDEQIGLSASAPRFVARIRSALRLKEAEERADRHAGHLLALNTQLERAVRQRDDHALQTQDMLIFAMAKMAEMRGQESSGHLLRMQGYVRALSEQAMRLPAFAPVIDDAFVSMIERCVLLHDIGKVAIPDHIMLKPAKLDLEERSIMESHTILGATMLEAVAKQHGACLAFLQMAIDIVRHHHERWDGTGYPDSLAGSTIPLAARIVTIADVYDAMRSKLVYKPGLAHSSVRRLMGFAAQGQFDPALLMAFQQCEANFEQIFAHTKD